MAEIRDAVMVDYARTPFGVASRKNPGFFADKRADDLAAVVVEELIKRTRIDPASIDEIIMGAVYQGGEQSSPGRGIGLMTCPVEVAALSVDRACCSSMTGAHIACMAIQLGLGDIFIVGGIESHSHFPAPLITADTDLVALAEEIGSSRGLPNARIFEKVDLNAVVSMGLIAEKLAAMYDISREEQDQWALRSNLRAAAAQREGKFKHEIVPIEGKLPDGTVKLVDYDQGVRPDSTIEKIRSLPPLYKPDGTICAASTSGENDGAAVAVLMSKEKAKELGLVPMVTVRAMAWVGVDPAIMGYGATVASRKALERAGLSVDDVDLWETNEAFATLPLLQIKEMGIDPEKMNVNGGACCIGHPTGASGMRVLGTLAYEMNRRGARYGLAAICGAWGAGAATVVVREDYWEGRRAFLS
ncbi:MAG: thiolase family protein [Dehalococcoidia bacterium]|nr:MAG: thiolase family protein [Dehalococcoidia bacterium]